MKRALLITLLFSFSIIVKSQIAWCDSGATWHYGHQKFAEIGTYTMTYDGDTLINNITTKKIKKYYYYYDQMFNTSGGGIAGYEYTYISNDVVYLYNKKSNDFDTLCNFRASIGDKWKASRNDDWSPCDTGFVTVIDTGSKVINGILLKWIYVNNQFNSNFQYTDTIYERIGYANFYLYPSDYCQMQIDAHEGGPLLCYSDSVFPLFKSFMNCGIGVGIKNSLTDKTILFYPNPTIGILKFENLPINEEVNYNIYALNGKIIQQGIINANQVDISSFENGVYFLEINIEGKSKKYKVVKTN